MDNNFGLYTVDATQELLREDYPLFSSNPAPENTTWERTEILMNGSPITKTAIEFNKYGTYVLDNELLLNGSNVVESTEVSSKISDGILYTDTGVRFNDSLLSFENQVIDITLLDYISLRQGDKILGYSRYNDRALYRIVDDVNDPNLQKPEVSEFILELTKGMKNLIYNNYVNNWPDLPLKNTTYTDVDTPRILVRHIDLYGLKGKPINIKFFVDTKYFDSINKGIIDDRFTIIIEDKYGNDIYHRNETPLRHYTTYAGEFNALIGPFYDDNGNPIVGETWFSIRCIDNHGRGSCEWFFTVYIRDTNSNGEFVENLYPVTNKDLDDYGITLGESSNDPVKSYKNRLGFSRLVYDVKKGVKNLNGIVYNGIKFPNSKESNKDVNSDNNDFYYISLYPDLSVVDESTNKNLSLDDDLENRSYLKREYSSFKFPKLDYYILKYNPGVDDQVFPYFESIQVKGKNESSFRTATIKNSRGSYEYWNNLTLADLEDFKIEEGKTFIINGREVTVDKDPIEWIASDSAYICREDSGENAGKIRRPGVKYDFDSENEYTPTYVDSDGKTYEDYSKPYLRTISINGHYRSGIKWARGTTKSDKVTVLDATTNKKSGKWYPFKTGEGYYYVSWYTGRRFKNTTDGNWPIACGQDTFGVLKDFIIDFNYSKFKLFDARLLESRTELLDASLSYNVEFRNGHILGYYDPFKEGFLHEMKLIALMLNNIKYAPWEGCGLVGAVSSKFCTFNNMRITNSMGYDCALHAQGSGNYSKQRSVPSNYPTFNSSTDPTVGIGYVSVNGTFIKDSSSIILKDGQSLLPENSPERIPNKPTTDVCLATSDFISLSNIYCRYYRANPLGTPPEILKDTTNNIPYLWLGPTVNDSVYAYYNLARRVTGKYAEYFIHFYDDNGKFIRSVKTLPVRRVYNLKGASKVKLSFYTVGSIVEGEPTLYYEKILTKDYSKPNLPADMSLVPYIEEPRWYEAYKLVTDAASENITFKDCNFYLSLSSQIRISGINVIIDNCDLKRIGFAIRGASVAANSRYPIGMEEQGCVQCLLELKNSKIDRWFIDGYQEEEATLRFAREATFVNIINSIGFNVLGFVWDMFIDNCYQYAFAPGERRPFMTNSLVIIRDTIIPNNSKWELKGRKFSSEEIAFMSMHDPYFYSSSGNILAGTIENRAKKYNVFECSVCEENDLSNLINIENCFFGTTPNRSTALERVGRIYYDSRNIYDSYYTKYFMRNLWNKIKDYDPTMGEDSWVHMIIHTPEDNFNISFGFKIGQYLQRININGQNKPLIYLDGEIGSELYWVDNGSWNVIKIPNKGYHLFSYKLIPESITNSKETLGYNKILIKEEMLYAQFPNTVSNESKSIYFVKDPESDQPGYLGIGQIAFGYDMPVTFKCPYPPYATGPVLSIVHVPKGAVQNYVNIHTKFDKATDTEFNFETFK